MGAKWNYTLLALLAFVCVEAQINLVPNPSFEDTLRCPDFLGQINRVNHWSSPTNATPDILTVNYCHTYANSNYIGLPNSPIFGFQNPRSGIAIAGAVFYANNQGSSGREYLQVHLSSPLIAGKIYCVKYYVSLGDLANYYAIKNFGAYFSMDSIYIEGDFPFLPIITYEPKVSINTLINDTSSWKEISGYFTALGDEEFMLIGNFEEQGSVDTLLFDENVNNKVAYYFVDDVYVFECDSTLGLIEGKKEKIKIYPNPAQDYVRVDLPKNINQASLYIYNLTGQLVLQKQITQPNQTVPITELGNGVYVFVVESGGEVVGRRRVVISK